MNDQWDGKVVMSTPGGPIVTMSLGEVLARKDAEIERLRAENAQLIAELNTMKAGFEVAYRMTGDKP